MTKNLLITFLIFLSHYISIAQPPNDEICDAIIVSVNEDGLMCPPEYGIDYSNLDATESSFDACGFSAYKDIWFKFVATTNHHRILRSLKITASPGSIGFINPGIAVYSSVAGSCTDITSVQCKTNGHFIERTDFVVGETYYVRVYTANSATLSFSTELCIGAMPSVVPLNDNCAGAISLNGGAVHEVYTDKATKSLNGNLCFYFGDSDTVKDVWYKVTAEADGPFTIHMEPYSPWRYDDSVSKFHTANMEYYTACGASIIPEHSINCNDAFYDPWTFEIYDDQNLTIDAIAGESYFFRMYLDNGGDLLDNGAGYFKVWATEPLGGSVLPVEMGQLNTTLLTDNSINLQWDFYNAEDNTKEFIIEKSMDGITFLPIDIVNLVEGDTKYSFTDYNTTFGNHYYRIKMHAGDRVLYSNVSIQNIGLSAYNSIVIRPNPLISNEKMYIDVTTQSPKGQLTIMDMNGKVIIQQTMVGNTLAINLAAHPLNKGVYLLKYQNEQESFTSKLVISK